MNIIYWFYIFLALGKNSNIRNILKEMDIFSLLTSFYVYFCWELSIYVQTQWLDLYKW